MFYVVYNLSLDFIIYVYNANWKFYNTNFLKNINNINIYYRILKKKIQNSFYHLDVWLNLKLQLILILNRFKPTNLIKLIILIINFHTNSIKSIRMLIIIKLIIISLITDINTLIINTIKNKQQLKITQLNPIKGK